MEDSAIFQTFPLLSTSRCLLVEPIRIHALDLFEIFGDDETMAYMQSPPVSRVEQCIDLLVEWQAEYDNSKAIRWAILLKEDPEKLIGILALHYWSRENRRVEIGAYFNRSFWGRGYAHEVTALVIDFAFNVLSINRLELRCDPRNTASTVIAEKFGMTFEGILREHVFVEGTGFVDEAVYALLKKNYIQTITATVDNSKNQKSSV